MARVRRRSWGPDVRQPGALQQCFEGGNGEVAETQGPPCRRAKEEAVVFPEVPDLEPFGILAGLVGAAREAGGVRTNIERAMIGKDSSNKPRA